MVRKNNMIKTVLTIAFSIIIIAGIVYSQSEGPGNLQAVSNGSVINLTWSAPSSGNASSYNVYKASAAPETSSDNFAGLNYTKINSTTMTAYQDSLGSMNSGTFVYYVIAVGSDGTESSPSNYAKVTVGK